jgi:hypothetical protein
MTDQHQLILALSSALHDALMLIEDHWEIIGDLMEEEDLATLDACSKALAHGDAYENTMKGIVLEN